jgi:hypothetical protein
MRSWWGTSEADQRTARTFFWVLVAAATIFRLLISGCFEFSTDEAHYVLYSRHLSWGYFDHPPMVGFLGALTGALGHGEWFMRLGPVLCWMVSLILLRGLALAIYGDERVSALCALILAFLPVEQLTGIALLPDATLNVFWCAGMLAGWHAVQEGKWRHWLLAGVCTGGAMLSKYHGVLMPLSFCLAVLFSRRGRRTLLSPWPYAAAVTAFLVFLPNILWNASHDWISYAFQLSHGGGSGRFDIGKLLKVVGGQMAVGSPVLAGMLPVAWFQMLGGKGNRPDGDRYVAWFGVVVFGFFCAIGLFGKMLPHWTAVGWWAGALGIAAVVVRRLDDESTKWRRWFSSGVVTAGLMSATLYGAVAFPLAPVLHERVSALSKRYGEHCRLLPDPGPFKPEYDLANDVFGWKESAVRIDGIRMGMPNPGRTFIATHKFFSLSQLLVYMPESIHGTSLRERLSQYSLWFDQEQHRGWDALFVDENHQFVGPGRYSERFERVDQSPVEITTSRHGFPSHILRVYRCYGYKPVSHSGSNSAE